MDKDTLPIINDELSLGVATNLHVSQVRSWFSNSKQMLSWAGPSFGFPETEAAFIEQVGAFDFTSFSLLHKNELIGFGQYQIHPPFLHLARLVINPSYRGFGFSAALLTKLIEQGDGSGSIKTVSLFVFKNNLIAYRSYLSAGFTKKLSPSATQALAGCDFLTLTLR